MTAGVSRSVCRDSWHSRIPCRACRTAIVHALTLVQNWTALLKKSDFEMMALLRERRLSEVSLLARPSFKLPSMETINDFSFRICLDAIRDGDLRFRGVSLFGGGRKAGAGQGVDRLRLPSSGFLPAQHDHTPDEICGSRLERLPNRDCRMGQPLSS